MFETSTFGAFLLLTPITQFLFFEVKGFSSPPKTLHVGDRVLDGLVFLISPGGWNSSSSFHWWKYWHCSWWRCQSRIGRSGLGCIGLDSFWMWLERSFLMNHGRERNLRFLQHWMVYWCLLFIHTLKVISWLAFEQFVGFSFFLHTGLSGDCKIFNYLGCNLSQDHSFLFFSGDPFPLDSPSYRCFFKPLWNITIFTQFWPMRRTWIEQKKYWAIGFIYVQMLNIFVCLVFICICRYIFKFTWHALIFFKFLQLFSSSHGTQQKSSIP